MTETAKAWTPLQKWSFRFFFCFFVVYMFPFPFDLLQYVTSNFDEPLKILKWYDAIFDAYNNLLHKIVPWFAENIFHFRRPITIFTNGSGDTTYDYFTLLFFFLLSVAGAVIWSVMDRKRLSYSTLYHWLRVLVRYNLALTMLLYGSSKIFHLQMPYPYLGQLVQPFGYKSPMGLAWSFVGYSKAFSAFTGLGEAIGGALLFYRRTTTLGALLLVTVLSNVVAINYCFDVPVKLYSSVLLLMSIFLVQPDAGRLWNVLVRNKATMPVPGQPVLTKRWMRIAWLATKSLIIVFSLAFVIKNSIHGVSQYGDSRPKPHYYGIYNVQSWTRNKDTVPPMATDTTRWKRLILDFPGFAVAYLMNDSTRSYIFNVDSTFRQVTLYPRTDTSKKYQMSINGDSTLLTIAGVLKGDSVVIRLKKQDLNDFRLVSRGFNWINEFPYNR